MSFISSLESVLQAHKSHSPGEVEDEKLETRFQTWAKESMVKNGPLTILAITSTVPGGAPIEGHRTGMGKTTLALRVARKYTHYHPEQERFDTIGEEGFYSESEEAYGPVNESLFADPWEMKDALFSRMRKGVRTPVAIWDDVEKAAPSTTGITRKLSSLLGEIYTWRYAVGMIIMTFPGLAEIQAKAAKLPDFEFIIPRRGTVDMQQHHFQRDWRNPRVPRQKMRQLGLGAAFGPLPPNEQAWYDGWRMRSMLGDQEPTLTAKRPEAQW
ncbi:MAG: hypothetical protein JRN50_02165 [Nitrososphaerota archaeon]|nr:hypothetical protein [Nitrososphaerota archaeon]